MGLFFPLRGPLCAGEAFIPSRPGGPSAAQCYMARRDVGPRFVPRYRSLLHPTYLRWLLKQKGCGQMQRGSRNLNGVQKVYTENYVLAENNDSNTQHSGMMPASGAGGPEFESPPPKSWSFMVVCARECGRVSGQAPRMGLMSIGGRMMIGGGLAR